MTVIEKAKRSVVCVCVDGVDKGTGVVVAEGKVLTCSHVLGDKENWPNRKFSIKFLGAMIKQAEDGNSGCVERCEATEVEIDGDFVADGDHDLAVLKWTGALPKDVEVSCFSMSYPRPLTQVFAFGFPESAKYWAQADFFSMVEETIHKETNSIHWTICSNVVSHAFSGAPVFSQEYGTVIGIAVEIKRMDATYRNMSTGYVIPVPTIVKALPQLKRLLEPSINAEHQRLISKLKADMAAKLRSSATAIQKLRDLVPQDIFVGPGSSEEMRIVDCLVEAKMSFPDLALALHQCQKSLEQNNDIQGALAISRLYATILSTTLNPDIIKRIREGLSSNDKFVVVPSTHCSLVEVFMAGAEGRLAEFRKIDAGSRDVPVGRQMLRAAPPDKGITSPADRAKSLRRPLSDQLNIVESEFVDQDAWSDQIRAQLRLEALFRGHVYLVTDGNPQGIGVWFTDDVSEHVNNDFPALKLVRRVPPDPASRQAQTNAMAPWISRDLLPPCGE
jgi:hypothetical protein